jgi:hypothetical protein
LNELQKILINNKLVPFYELLQYIDKDHNWKMYSNNHLITDIETGRNNTKEELKDIIRNNGNKVPINTAPNQTGWYLLYPLSFSQYKKILYRDRILTHYKTTSLSDMIEIYGIGESSNPNNTYDQLSQTPLFIYYNNITNKNALLNPYLRNEAEIQRLVTDNIQKTFGDFYINPKIDSDMILRKENIGILNQTYELDYGGNISLITDGVTEESIESMYLIYYFGKILELSASIKSLNYPRGI